MLCFDAFDFVTAVVTTTMFPFLSLSLSSLSLPPSLPTHRYALTLLFGAGASGVAVLTPRLKKEAAASPSYYYSAS